MVPRIIILEDEDLLRIALTRAFLKKGYEVFSFSNPILFSESNEISLHDLHYGDFLLTDIHMPNMSGLEFIERQTEHGCDDSMCNKAVMSAFWTDENFEKAKRLGCEIFHKPFVIKEMMEWLEERKNNFQMVDNYSPCDLSVSNQY